VFHEKGFSQLTLWSIFITTIDLGRERRKKMKKVNLWLEMYTLEEHGKIFFERIHSRVSLLLSLSL
jgi:hypothetical protein